MVRAGEFFVDPLSPPSTAFKLRFPDVLRTFAERAAALQWQRHLCRPVDFVPAEASLESFFASPSVAGVSRCPLSMLRCNAPISTN